MPRYFDSHSLGVLACDGADPSNPDDLKQYSFSVAKSGSLKEGLGWGANEYVPELDFNPPPGVNVTTVYVEEDNAKSRKTLHKLALTNKEKYGAAGFWVYPERSALADWARTGMGAGDGEPEADTDAIAYADALDSARDTSDDRPVSDGHTRDLATGTLGPDDHDRARARAQEDTTADTFAPDESGAALLAAQPVDEDEVRKDSAPDVERLAYARAQDAGDEGSGTEA